jgi:hypothetical protein
MDLYGSGASISQANSQTQAARQLNQESADFNRGLAEQLDTANMEEDQDRQQKFQKNILSGVTATGKLALKKEFRQRATRGIISGGRFVKTSMTEKLEKEAPIASQEEIEDVYRTGARPVSPELGARSTLREGEQLTADVSGETGERVTATATARAGEEAATEGIETSAKALAEKGAAEAIEKSGVKTLGKVASGFAKVGKVGAAGLGGALDAGGDISRLIEGKRGMEVFGSNAASQTGNIMNIVGSGLEVAGVLGAAFPPALILEGLGAAISVAGAVTEGVGDEEASEQAKTKAEKDITSQARSQAVSENVQQVVGRTQ